MDKRIVLGAVALVAASVMTIAAWTDSGARVRAQESTPPSLPSPSLTVIGEGHVDATPDIAQLQLGVQTTAETAEAAQQANAERMNAVVASLRERGVADRDLRTSGLSLGPVMNREQRITGYRAQNMLTVTIRELSQAGALYDAAVAAGANVGGQIHFGFADATALQREALAAAVVDARARAEVTAQAAGVTLRGIRSITEEGTSIPTPRPLPVAAPAIEQTPIQPGEQRITARVRIVFDL